MGLNVVVNVTSWSKSREHFILFVVFLFCDPDAQNISPLCVLSKTRPNVFARPVKEENEAFGCFVIPNAKLHSRRYLVDDTLFIQVEISP